MRIQDIKENTQRVPFSLYSTDDGSGQFPGWPYVRGVVAVADSGDWQTNKKAAVQAGIDQGIIPLTDVGFWTAREIDREEIDALRKIVRQLEGL